MWWTFLGYLKKVVYTRTTDEENERLRGAKSENRQCQLGAMDRITEIQSEGSDQSKNSLQNEHETSDNAQSECNPDTIRQYRRRRKEKLSEMKCLWHHLLFRLSHPFPPILMFPWIQSEVKLRMGWSYAFCVSPAYWK